MPSLGGSPSAGMYLNPTPAAILTSVSESPHFYIGFSDLVNVEVGFQYNAATSNYPARFTPYVRDGLRPKKNNGQYIQPGPLTYDRVMLVPPRAAQAYISATGAGLGLLFEIRARIDIRSKTIRFYSQAFDGASSKSARLALVVKSSSIIDINAWISSRSVDLRPRYVMALAQGSSTYEQAQPFDNAQMLLSQGLPNAYWATGSHIENGQIMLQKIIRQNNLDDSASSLESMTGPGVATTPCVTVSPGATPFVSIETQ